MKVLVSILILTITAGMLYAEGQKQAPSSTATGFARGEITYMEGEVTVDNLEAEFGMKVQPGAIVETGADSRCDIVFGEKNILRLYGETLVEINVAKGNANLRSGSLGAVFDKLSAVVTDDGSRFQINSPQVVGGVRGTVFFLKVEEPGSTYLCTCFGSMTLEDNQEGNQKNVEAYHHKAYRYIAEADTVRTESASLLYHDDESMEAIAEQIGEEILWRGENGY